MSWDEDLRPAQRDAAGSPRGNYVLLAGPGTGKTFVLVRRIQYLVEECGVDPSAVTALTFTRAAAGEMRARLLDLLGAGFRVRVSTLHSYALRELLKHGTGAIPHPVRVVDDWEERWVVIEEIARYLNRTVPQIREVIGRLADDWDSLAVDGEGWEEGFPDPEFLTAWREHRQIYRYTLRSELVYQLLQLFRHDPDFVPSGVTEVLLVDEYQDLNHCDLATVQFICARTEAEIFAAGDDDQSIYSFRHAHPQAIRDFGEVYHGATRLVLAECLRCGETIVSLANWLIAQEIGRVPKTLESVVSWDSQVHLLRSLNDEEEAGEIARIISEEVDGGRPPEEILVLLRFDRNNAVSGQIAEALAAREVLAYRPRVGPGASQNIQRLLEYLKLSEALKTEEIDDLALRSLLELENNNVGTTRIRAIVNLAWNRSIRFSEAIDWLRDNPGDYSSTSLNDVLGCVDAILDATGQLIRTDGETFQEWLNRVSVALALGEEEHQLVGAAAAELEAVTADVPEMDVAAEIDFVQELAAALSNVEEAPPTLPGHVTITTMHGAKGLSADIVFALQVEDEVLPDTLPKIEFDESRRLLYVSVTRAREKLFISTAASRGPIDFVGGEMVPRMRTLSRFLSDYGLTAIRSTDYP